MAIELSTGYPGVIQIRFTACESRIAAFVRIGIRLILEFLQRIDSKGDMKTRAHLKTLTSIVAIDLRGAIGIANQLPWILKSDLKYFKEQTLNNSIIMGRKTYQSIGGCLKGRKNIVLTHNFDLFPASEDCRPSLSIAESLYRAEVHDSSEIFVIGGAMTYEQFAPLVDRYLVTIVAHEVENADAHLDPKILAELSRWGRDEIMKVSASEGRDQFEFAVYEITPDDLEERHMRRTELYRSYADRVSKPQNLVRKKPSGNSGHKQLSLI